jgi:hypothetical protein
MWLKSEVHNAWTKVKMLLKIIRERDNKIDSSDFIKFNSVNTCNSMGRMWIF